VEAGEERGLNQQQNVNKETDAGRVSRANVVLVSSCSVPHNHLAAQASYLLRQPIPIEPNLNKRAPGTSLRPRKGGRESQLVARQVTSSGGTSDWSLYLCDEREEVCREEQEWERQGEDASSELQLALKASSDFWSRSCLPLLCTSHPLTLVNPSSITLSSSYGSQPWTSPSILPCSPSVPPFPFRRGPLRPLSPAHRDVSLRVGCRISENCLG
jgi:hypothetical protein